MGARSAFVRLLTATALLLGACRDPATSAGEEDPWVDVTDLERQLGLACAGATVCTGAASGANDLYASTYRIGTTDTGRGELLQTFTTAVAGTPTHVRLQLRNLRRFTTPVGTPSYAHVEIVQPTGAEPRLTAAPLATGEVDLATVGSGETDIALDATEALVPGTTYALYLYADPVAPGGTGTTMFGVGALATQPYAGGDAWRRGLRRLDLSSAWAETRFRPAGSWDLAFALTLRPTPGAPTAVNATRTNGHVVVSWTAPASPGGSPISSYTVTASPGGAQEITADGSTTSLVFDGLGAGGTYTFTVHATNAAGAGVESDPSLPISAAVVPGPPLGATALAGDALAHVSWSAPASEGGSPVTRYTVTASPGGASQTTADGTTTSLDFTGLTNGLSYTFTVRATNAVGAGAESEATNAVTPRGVPGAPSNVNAVAGNAQATITWTAPVANGAPLTGYTVTAQPSGATQTANASATSLVFTGLTNGLTYAFTVRATNAAGDGPDSSSSPSVSPAAAPDAPTGLTGTRGSTLVNLTWTAPASSGGSPLTSYTVTASPGGAQRTTADGTTTTLAFTGLTNGTAYTFTVHATNAAGNGPESAPSASVTPSTVPGIPTGVTASPGNTQATIAWTAPASTGGAIITSYTVTVSPGGTTQATSNGSARTLTITGLTNGQSYTFTVRATNLAGSSAESASASTVPVAVPGAPTGATASGGHTQATVGWTAPASTGGSPITSYVVTASPGGAQVTTGASTTSAIVTGLTNGTAYTFTVRATSAIGTGPESTPTPPVTPMTVPGSPGSISTIAGNGSVTVSWTAPASNGGVPITSYTVTQQPDGTTATTGSGTATSLSFTGLTNGTAYTFTVHATNAAGNGAESASSAPTTPITLPDAPTSIVATPGDTFATLAWVAPASTGGSPLTSYTVTATPGGATRTTFDGSTPALTFGGLTNGTAYTFTVRATNASGSSSESAPSAPVTPATVPGAPTGVVGTPGNASAVVAWIAPSSNGGAAIASYTVTVSPGGATFTTANGTTLSRLVTGLVNGQSYTFSVLATNAAGDGEASSASAAVTPQVPAGSPGVPTSVTASAGVGQASVAWTAPASNGGSPLTSYTVTASPGGQQVTTANGTTTAVTFPGLANGTNYTFTVHATNAAGSSAESSASNAVTPVSVPGAPSAVTAMPGNAQVVVGWTAPASTGGAPILSYRLTASPGGAQTTTESGTVTSVTFVGLTNGVAYTFTVQATNVAGTGAASAPSGTVTPSTVPSAPTNVSAVKSGSQIIVGWTPSASNGGAPVLNYTVTASPGGAQQTTADGTASSLAFAGLTNGVAYTFTVHATNVSGSSLESGASEAITPAVAPAAPTDVTAVASANAAAVSWSSPLNDGGSPVLSYTVTVTPGGQQFVTPDGATTSILVPGLTNGTAYTFTVRATNLAGSSAESMPSAPVTPVTLPGVPTSVSTVAGNGQVTVSWFEPADLGGGHVLSYTVSALIGGSVVQAFTSVGTGTSLVATGLANGTAYTFTVHATNEAGAGDESSASSATTPVTTPGAPTSVVATRGNTQAGVSWAAPSTGGTPITQYTVTATPGGATATSTTTTATVSGLTNGTSYTFQVRATNAVGNGPDSAASNAVVPAAVPGPPTSVIATRTGGNVTISWAAPASNGGTAITSYTATLSPTNVTATVAGLSATIAGAVNGVNYTATVHATNSVGDGLESAPSNNLLTCDAGYTTNGTTCVDNDECVLSPTICGAGACTNTAGSYSCGCPAGFTLVGAACQLASTPAPATVSLGSGFGCRVSADGTLWCWGANTSGQVGNSSVAQQNAPVQIGNATNWASVAAGTQHACALKTDRTLWCWGNGANGQIGNNSVTNVLTPVQVDAATDWSQVTAGTSHTCALKTTGTAWCWGLGANGQVGNGTNGTFRVPTQVSGAGTWSMVAAGASHTCGTKTDGTLWCWGAGAAGQLGIGGVPASQTTPAQLAGSWLQATAGQNHTCAVKADHTIWCWGQGTSGQLGNGAQVPATSPVQAGSASNWALVRSGVASQATYGLTLDGVLYGWGLSSTGALGLGETSAIVVTVPTAIAGPPSYWSAQLAAGNASGMGIGVDGATWFWGLTGAGRLGMGSETAARPVPAAPAGPTNAWLSLGTSKNDFQCGVRAGGTLWCWGLNTSGQLAQPTYAFNATAPRQVAAATDWTLVREGGTSACGLASGNRLWCWGNGANGQLGTGNATSVTTPALVLGTGWSGTFSVGVNHACGVKTDGTLWCWGQNTNGQVGLGHTVNPQATPVQVGSASNWTSVGAGASYTCGTRADGTLWCWGLNSAGQLGDGSTTQQASPVRIGAAQAWSTVTTGQTHTCALTTAGSAWCWGTGTNGQLGVGGAGTSLVPQLVVGPAFASISAGTTHTCATRADNTGWCWGLNGSGQIGNGGTAQQTLPAQVSPGTFWSALAAGHNHTCGTTTDGAGWCWGSGSAGQLGDGFAWQVSPASLPGAPTNLAASISGTLLTVTWTAPSYRGNTPLTGYTITASAGTTSSVVTAAPNATRATLAGLAAGSAYTLSLTANNAAGAGTAATLGATLPGVPTGVSASGANGAVVSWVAPVSAGAPISSYTVTTWPDGTTTTAAGNATSVAIGGLADGGSYTFTVSASNAAGSGPESAPTNAITACQKGFSWTGSTCVDVNECTQAASICGAGRCTNTNGSYACACNAGFTFTGGVCTQPAATAGLPLSLGSNHGCSVRSNGTLWCWGVNTNYQLGLGHAVSPQLQAVPVGTATNWATVSAGAFHTCGTRTDGTLWCWGSNGVGAIGNAGNPSIPVPSPVQVGTATNWTSVSTGSNTSCGVRADGSLWCWGDDALNQLGDGGSTTQSAPVRIGAAQNWASVSAGLQHACGVTTDGKAYCWGNNTNGQVGNGQTTQQPTPLQVGSGTDWVQIASGAAHTCGVRRNADATLGQLWCWGQGSSGQLGYGATTSLLLPTQVSAATNWVAVRTGEASNSTYAVRADGSLWSFGANGSAQLGLGIASTAQPSPQRVQPPASWTNIITASTSATLAVAADGTIYSWGGTTSGVVGTNTDATARVVPSTLAQNGPWSVLRPSRSDHQCAIKTDGTLWCWGANVSGQLGNGLSTALSVPTQVGAMNDWTDVSQGALHTCALRGSAPGPVTLWCWGQGSGGQLGNGNTATVNGPSPSNTSTWLPGTLSAGSNHTCALKQDQTLWCWGNATSGQIGTGNTVSVSTPTQIGTSTWTSVAAGLNHTCGVQADGTLWCWGLDSANQLGDNNTVQQNAPIRIGTLTRWAQVAAASTHTCATQTDGTAWCWGANTNGQLGTGDTVSQAAPTQVALGSNWAALSTGVSHTCGRRTDGTAWCWGLNTNGQLGIGSLFQQPYPVQVGTSPAWTTVVTGQNHSCGLLSGGTLSCWGSDLSGQVGDGVAWALTPALPPGPPTSVVATSVGTQITLSWGPPTLVGSSPLTGYLATATSGGAVATLSAAANAPSVTFTNLTPGITYYLSVQALSAAGPGASATAPPTVPAPPTNVTATAGTGVAVAWTPPVTAGAPVSSYTVTANPGGVTRTVSGSRMTLSGLTNGASYTVTVHATNLAGLSLESAPAGPVRYCDPGTGWNGSTCVDVNECTSTPGICGPGTCTNTPGSYTCACQGGFVSSGTVCTPPSLSASPVSLGAGHGCRVKADGTLWCWGANGSGQIGNGTTTTPQLLPYQVDGAGNWSSVSAGAAHTCALRTDGSLWCWGALSANGLGGTNVLVPTAVTPGAVWASLGTGDLHSCGVRTDGTLWCWGNNAQGQLGDPAVTFSNLPRRIGTGTTWASVGLGGFHSCATQRNGTLWCWGVNSSGMLGVGNTASQQTPQQVGTGTDWAQVVGGALHTCGIRRNGDGTPGTLWCWGSGASGQLGLGGTVNQTSPVQVGVATNWAQVRMGQAANTTFAVTTDGALWGFGQNNYGQIGISTSSTLTQYVPARITTPGEWTTAIAANASTSTGITLDGTWWTWGSNNASQSGVGFDGATRLVPMQIPGTWATALRSMKTQSTCATKSDGTLWCWGSGSNGQLGNGLTSNTAQPAQVNAATDWSAATQGNSHGCGVRGTGPASQMWCWGFNSSNQLGNGATVQSNSPVQAAGTNWAGLVTAGQQHTVALKTDGTIWGWGSSLVGQLGLGSATSQPTPIQIGTATWTSVAAGTLHTCGTQTDGSLWCWGSNSTNALGDGSAATQQLSPVRIAVAAGSFLQAGAGNQSGYAIRSDRTLWAWGLNSNSQLGNGNTTQLGVPTQIGAATNWASVSGGGFHACGTRTDGTLWCWGNNGNGQLGLGHTTLQATPVQVGTATNWASVSAGNTHTCATRTDQTLWCWGANTSGQVGDGSMWYGVPVSLPGAPTGVSITSSTSTTATVGWTAPIRTGSSALTGFTVTSNPGGLTVSTGPGATSATVTGLTNGTFYTFSVTAQNAYGAGDPAYTTPAVPGAPTAITASQVANVTTVSWTAPASNGGAPISSYTITTTPPTGTYTSNGTSAALTGLPGGVNYGFTVFATNAAGNGPPASGCCFLPLSLPGAPTGLTALAQGGVVLTWSPPAFDGGVPVLSYTVTASPGGATVVSGTTSTAFNGLTPGQSYTFTVRATNANGSGPESAPTGAVLACGSGFTSQGGNCVDVNECTASPTPVCGVGTCSNTTGSYTCSCPGGYAPSAGTCGSTTSATAALAARSVAAGNAYACRVRANHTLWCAGINTNGQLGDGSTTTRLAATQVPGTTWATVATGLSHTCATRTDGTLWCWGLNTNGQLGDGTTVQKTSPLQIGSGTSWASVVAGQSHTCALQTGGALFCWGLSTSGQSGTGVLTNVTAPTPVSGTYAQVSLGLNHSCGLRTDGTLWCWGTGQFGNGTTSSNQTTPIAIGAATWTSIAAGLSHTCGTRTDGTLWCWGASAAYQTGLNTLTTQVNMGQVGAASNWYAVVSGPAANSTCAFKQDGTLWCWGANAWGQLGLARPSGALVPAPTLVASTFGSPATWAPGQASVSGDETCAVANDGTTWCMGANLNGRLGLGTDGTQQASPSTVGGFAGAPTSWRAVSGGSAAQYGCGVGANGSLWCWGTNANFTLGQGVSLTSLLPQALLPVRVGSATGWGDARSIASGTGSVCATRPAGAGNSLFCWGLGSNGQLGTSSASTQYVPTQIGSTGEWSAAGLSSGTNFACALKADGTLWCWGANNQNQLGDGTTTDRLVPTPVGSSTWTTLGLGPSGGCAVNTDGSLRCWGFNGQGQLGLGHQSNQSSPQIVTSATAWSSVSGGNAHTCATKTDGSLWCWGNNFNGQVGNGTSSAVFVLSPSRVGSLNTWADVSCGANHVCARRTDGTLWCWGQGANGQLGLGSVTQQNAPVQVGTSTNWAGVQASLNHTCGIRTDGSLQCWGSNGTGQLGDGTTGAVFPLASGL